MSFRALVRPSALALRAPVAMPLRRTLVSEASGQQFVDERRHASDHAGKSADLWRKVSFYICIPGAIVLGIYIYGIEAAHIAHRDHEIHENGGQLPERTVYEYNDIRKKPMPWGPNSIFFNPKANRDLSEA